MEGEGYTCKYCSAYISDLDMAYYHECLENQDIYIGSNNVLYTNLDTNEDLNSYNEPSSDNQKTIHTIAGSSEISATQNKSAVWTDNAIMALLSLYEANMHMLDHPKKKTKIWTAISNGLKDLEIEMSTDQVRWKMNVLQKKYKECCDNNIKSGRGRIEFKWYNQLDEIFGKNKDAIASHTVSSQIIGKKNSKSVLSGQKDVAKDPANNCTSKSSLPSAIKCVSTSPIASTSTVSVVSPLMNNKNKETTIRPRHGTGSNLANRKLNIEQQWLKFLEDKEVKDTKRDERHTKSEERAIENFTLKKQIVALKRKQIEQKKELLNKKLKDKENRHAEIMEIEKTKCKLLKQLLNTASTKNLSDSDEQ